jgi:hypothetical protein
MWFYGLLANFTESQFFSLDKQIWLLVVIAISMVHNTATMRPEGRTRRPISRGSSQRSELAAN